MSEYKDTKGQNQNVSQKKPNLSAHNGASDTSPIVFFKKDRVFHYTYKKSEKIASAIYLLTSFFHTEEPLRSQLRLSVIRLLDDELDLIQEAGTSSVETHERIRKIALHLVSLLQAGFYAGLISEMNFSVLRNELMGVLNKLSEQPTKDEHGALFDDSFFAVSELSHSPEDTAYTSPASPAVAADTKHADAGISPTATDRFQRDKTPREYKTSQSSGAQSTPSHRGRTKTEAKKNERRAVILDIIGRKGKVSIGDIAEEFSGCSEKTIQRELGALVEEGVLRREGERRWSRYMRAAGGE